MSEMKFYGISVSAGKPCEIEVEQGIGLYLTAGTLFKPPKNERTRVSLSLFEPENPELSIPLAVFSEACGMSNCRLKLLTTKSISLRLDGDDINGAIVHVVGNKGRYNGEEEYDEDVPKVVELNAENPVAPSNGKDKKSSKSKRARDADDEDDESEPKPKAQKAIIGLATAARADVKDPKNSEKKQEKANKAEQKKNDKADKPVAKKERKANKPATAAGKPPTKVSGKRAKDLKTGVKITELLKGTGKPVKSGRNVAVQYQLRLQNGKLVDKSTKHGFKFRLGVGECIPGFDAGVEGMREGGHREVIVPSAMGYGRKGAPPDIPPNATLLFDVKVMKAW